MRISNTLLPIELDTAMSPMPARTRGHSSEGGDLRIVQGLPKGLSQPFGLTARKLAGSSAGSFARWFPPRPPPVFSIEYVFSVERNGIEQNRVE